MSTAIQVAVAQADLVLCRIAALPWGMIGLGVLVMILLKAGCRRWRT